jgi:glycine/D-amino acid oxidase-like deaminating enzyme
MAEAGSTPETWYEATRVASPERPRLGFEIDVDVCVIGAGLAGLTVALEVARRGWSVAVLEANRIAWAASGRNTGFVLPGFSDDIDSMIERIGFDHTRRLWALSEAGLDYVRRMIKEHRMPGVAPIRGWLKISNIDDGHAIPRYVARLRRLGAEVEAWSTDQVRALLPNPHYFNGVYFPRAFHMHPLNYALGLAKAAEAAGVRIFEETPALAIDTAGVRKRIATPDARVRAGHVVLAGNVHLGDLMPRLAATLMPLNTYVMVSEPIGPKLSEVIRYRGAVSDGKRADNHYRIVDADRLQWSGRMTVWPAQPQRFARSLVHDIGRKFPALGRVNVAYIWRGTLGRTVHRMPQIGEIERGLWVTSGFGGHGLNTSAMAGELIARGIVENDQSWRLFAPYELVWAGGLVGRAAVQAVYWGSKPLERMMRHLALSNERTRRRKAAKQARKARKVRMEAAAREAAKAAPEPAGVAPAQQAVESPPSSPRAQV